MYDLLESSYLIIIAIMDKFFKSLQSFENQSYAFINQRYIIFFKYSYLFIIAIMSKFLKPLQSFKNKCLYESKMYNYL